MSGLYKLKWLRRLYGEKLRASVKNIGLTAWRSCLDGLRTWQPSRPPQIRRGRTKTKMSESLRRLLLLLRLIIFHAAAAAIVKIVQLYIILQQKIDWMLLLAIFWGIKIAYQKWVTKKWIGTILKWWSAKEHTEIVEFLSKTHILHKNSYTQMIYHQLVNKQIGLKTYSKPWESVEKSRFHFEYFITKIPTEFSLKTTIK